MSRDSVALEFQSSQASSFFLGGGGCTSNPPSPLDASWATADQRMFSCRSGNTPAVKTFLLTQAHTFILCLLVSIVGSSNLTRRLKIRWLLSAGGMAVVLVIVFCVYSHIDIFSPFGCLCRLVRNFLFSYANTWWYCRSDDLETLLSISPLAVASAGLCCWARGAQFGICLPLWPVWYSTFENENSVSASVVEWCVVSSQTDMEVK